MSTKSTTEYWNEISNLMIDKIIDDYILIEELGRGSYGCLFLGQSLTDNTYVAIKILSKQGLDSAQLSLQQSEIDIQSALSHPNILALYKTIVDHASDYIYMVMELCDGGDLFEYIVPCLSVDNGSCDSDYDSLTATRCFIDDESTKKLFTQILDAIDYMHQRHIYHRDIKLENILLCQNNTVCKVADFGLATRERYSSEFGCGTTTYLGPEHFDDSCGNGYQYDAAASDVWSMGILLIALLFGRNPWKEACPETDTTFSKFCQLPHATLLNMFPELSNECVLFLSNALQLDPASRPSITELKEEFHKLEKLTCDENYRFGYDDDEKEQDEEYDDERVEDIAPLNIPSALYGKNLDKKVATTTTGTMTTATTTTTSFDSAIFSQNGLSWSDMVEEECYNKDFFDNHNKPNPLPIVFESEDDPLDHEEDELFIHSQEKESWWL